MPEPELTPSTVAGDDGSYSFLLQFLPHGCRGSGRVAKVTNFTMGSLGFSIAAPEITTNFRDFPLIMYGQN